MGIYHVTYKENLPDYGLIREWEEELLLAPDSSTGFLQDENGFHPVGVLLSVVSWKNWRQDYDGRWYWFSGRYAHRVSPGPFKFLIRKGIHRRLWTQFPGKTNLQARDLIESYYDEWRKNGKVSIHVPREQIFR